MALAEDDVSFVHRYPILHPVGKCIDHHAGIFGEPIGAGVIEPAAAAVKLERIIPVEQRKVWLDAGFQQAIDQLGIEIDAGLVNLAGSVGQNSRPGCREPVSFQVHLLHQLDIFSPSVIVVGRDIAGIVVENDTRPFAENIPHAEALTVAVSATFYLVRRRRCTPRKIFWKTHYLSLVIGWL